VPYKDPEVQRTYKREWKRLHSVGSDGRTRSGTQIVSMLPFKIRYAQDILALLEEQVIAVRNEAEAGTLEKARVIGYLASIALKAVETTVLDARLEAVENVLRNRSKAV
jgi:hypothetical protein